MKKGTKPGEFAKQKKRNKNIAINFEQLRLLKNEEITEATLLIQSKDGFKPVIVSRYVLPTDDPPVGTRVVYLADKGKGRKLRLGTVVDKDGLTIYSDIGIALRMDPKYILAIVARE